MRLMTFAGQSSRTPLLTAGPTRRAQSRKLSLAQRTSQRITNPTEASRPAKALLVVGVTPACQISGRSRPWSGTAKPQVRAQARTTAVLGAGVADAWSRSPTLI